MARGSVRVLTGSRYWKKWGNANHVWMEPVSSRPAISYFFASRPRSGGSAGRPTVSTRSIQIEPRSSVSQSLWTSRTIRVFAPGIGPNRHAKVPSGPTSSSRSSNAASETGAASAEYPPPITWNDRSAVVPRRPRTTYSASSVR